MGAPTSLDVGRGGGGSAHPVSAPSRSLFTLLYETYEIYADVRRYDDA